MHRNFNNHGQKVVLTLTLAILAVSIVSSKESFGAGLEAGDLGTVAIGRGTAFVARADNLTAFFYNPAGLPKSKGPNLLLVGNVAHQSLKYTRMGSDSRILLDENDKPLYGAECTTEDIQNRKCVLDPGYDFSGGFDSLGSEEEFGSVGMSKPFSPQPLLIFSWGGIGSLEDLALSVGVYAPPTAGIPAFPNDGAQRYVIRESSGIGLFPGIGISYAFNKYIQVGAVFESGLAAVEQNLAIRLDIQPRDTFRNEDAGGDADLTFKVEDYFIPSGVLGVLSNPLDWLELGASFRFPKKIAPKGSITYKAPSIDMPDSKIVKGRDEVSMSYLYPLVVRAGARYIHRLFDIEVDFVYEAWSQFEAKYDIDAAVDNDGSIIDFTGSGEFIKNFRDSYSVRLGGDVEVWPNHISLRLGGYYTSSAYPENHETFTIDAPYSTQIGVGGGLTWKSCQYLDVHAGYLHIFQPDVRVKEGIVQQIAPTVSVEQPDGSTIERDIGNIVNNGSYEVSLNIFGLSLEGHF